MIEFTDDLCTKYGLPLKWRAHTLEAVGSDKAPQVLMSGGVYPEVYSKGPRKGYPNYKRPEPRTERKICISLAEYREILAALPSGQ